MGIEVLVEDEDGASVLSLTDPENILHRILPNESDERFKHLSCIDWYGDTTFNRYQADGLARELARLKAESTNPVDLEFIDKLIAMAKMVANEPHLYLKFYGD